MTFGKKTLFSVLLGIGVLANIFELKQVNVLHTTTLFSFCTYILLPGFLVSLVLRIKKLSFWENLLIIVGLSIAFLELGGLLLNILLPTVGINDPLASQNIIIGFNAYILLLFILAWIRTKPFAAQIPLQSILGISLTRHIESGQTMQLSVADDRYRAPEDRDTITSIQAQPSRRSEIERALENVDTITSIQAQPSRRSEIENVDTISIQAQSLKHSEIENVLYILPIFFPVLAALGAIMINNGGSNILTLTLLGAIACYSFLLVLLRDKIRANLYPHAIFFIGMAILFTTSLRSWYITGHDIEREFYVFQLTNMHHIWNMGFYQDAYNACLSITILPTVLTHLLAIQDMYIYKVIFQILFATAPVLVFFIIRNYTTPVFAFLSAFFFMSFPTFFNDMPMLNRQEIGFIFFGLVIYMMLISKLSLSMRRTLFIVFALGIIISHYSTNFVVLVLVTLVYVLTLILSLPFVKNTFAWLLARSRIPLRNTFPNKAFLSLPLIVIIFSTTYVWNNLYTQSSDHAGTVLAEVVNSLLVKSNANNRSSDLSYSIFFSSKSDPQKQLQDYIQSVVKSAKAVNSGNANTSQFYNKTITSKYPTLPLSQEELAPTPLGNSLSSLHVPVFSIQAELRSLSAISMQIFVFIGLLIILFSKQKKPFDLQYLLLCLSAILLLALITVLPALSIEYGVLRMFQQLLFVLSLPIVLGLNSIFFFFKEQKRILLTGMIAIIFFLNLTGFLSHLTGNYYPQMTLDNAGIYYDAYYVHTSDVLAIAWLSKNNADDDPVESDLSGTNKLLTFGDISALNEIFPEIIRKNAYVYLEISSHTVVSIDKDVLVYNSSKPFLDDHKNLVYSNGKNNIYK
jgi:uncharacterized membrane protein